MTGIRFDSEPAPRVSNPPLYIGEGELVGKTDISARIRGRRNMERRKDSLIKEVLGLLNDERVYLHNDVQHNQLLTQADAVGL